MRAIDAKAQQEFGIPELLLMEHAGWSVAKAAHRFLRGWKRKRGFVLVLAGGGANGGDGFVAARHLENWGLSVSVLLLADPSRFSGAAAMNFRILGKLGVRLERIHSVAQLAKWERKSKKVSLAIDALLGTGVEGAVREPIRGAILWLNRQRFPVVSVDLPSGLSSDTGLPCAAAVKATLTVTCGLPKEGLRAGQGPKFSGRVVVADIGLPKALRDA